MPKSDQTDALAGLGKSTSNRPISFGRWGSGCPGTSPCRRCCVQLREEILATTKLPHGDRFPAGELRHCGEMASAMRKLAHYFTPFQAYVIAEAENERGRFDMRVAVEILRYEAEYRSGAAVAAGRVHVPVRGVVPESAPVRAGTRCHGAGSDLRPAVARLAADGAAADRDRRFRRPGLRPQPALCERTPAATASRWTRTVQCCSGKRKGRLRWPIAARTHSICLPPCSVILGYPPGPAAQAGR